MKQICIERDQLDRSLLSDLSVTVSSIAYDYNTDIQGITK